MLVLWFTNYVWSGLCFIISVTPLKIVFVSFIDSKRNKLVKLLEIGMIMWTHSICVSTSMWIFMPHNFNVGVCVKSGLTFEPKW
jgi:hypothetical protein